MTLVITAKNDSSIVVGADSLRGRSGTTDIYTDAKKLYSLRDDCVVLVAGDKFNKDAVNQFLLDFGDVVQYKRLFTATAIANELSSRTRSTIVGNLNSDSDLVFIVAGFDGQTPLLFRLHNTENDFESICIEESSTAAGRDSFAYEVLEELGVDGDMTTDMLEVSIYQVMYSTSGEFPNMVGGDMTVQVLESAQ